MIVLMGGVPSAVAGTPSLSEMVVVEKNHNQLTAAIQVEGVEARARIILGNANDYDQINVAYQEDALKHAKLYFIRANNGAAAIRIDNLRRIEQAYHVVLKSPESKHLFSYIVRPYGAGTFSVPLAKVMQYESQADMPKLAQITTKLKTHTKRNLNVFPKYPQPMIGKSSDASEDVALNKPTKEMLRNHEPVHALDTQANTILLNSPRMVSFGMKASHYLSDVKIIMQNGKAFLRLDNPAKAEIARRFKNNGFIQNVSFNSKQGHGDYFGWVTTNKYHVRYDDMAISDIVNEIIVDKTVNSDAAIAAIWEMNKKAFGNQSIYTLMAGAILNIPPKYLVDEIQHNPTKLRMLMEEATGVRPVY